MDRFALKIQQKSVLRFLFYSALEPFLFWCVKASQLPTLTNRETMTKEELRKEMRNVYDVNMKPITGNFNEVVKITVIRWNGLQMAANVAIPDSPWLSDEDITRITRDVLRANFKRHMWNRFSVEHSDTRDQDDAKRTCLYIEGRLITDFLSIELEPFSNSCV